MDLVAIALATDAVGFVETRYFHGVGYGLAMAAQAAFLASTTTLSVQQVLMVAFGVRLAAYLFLRGNVGAKSCPVPLAQRTVQPANHPPATPGPSLLGRAIMWVSSSLLFVAFAWPLRVAAGRPSSPLPLCVMAVGALLEAVADAQKALAKRREPRRFVGHGLFALSRHPAHFFELVMYWGSLLVAPPQTALDWAIAGFGLAAIHAVIIGGVRRLDRRQSEAYKGDKEFEAYVARTAMLVPFVH